MLETVAYWVDFLSKNDKVYYLTMTVLCIQGLFLIYLFLALFIRIERNSKGLLYLGGLIFYSNILGEALSLRSGTLLTVLK